ncbi:hypothetical protein ACOI1C_06060 [Bacillus sp. DJP31]|uniref:hypothetical protein n=1 Tax=Bacillus sp. DJP31 TaxID=3409789 RepID=UPI003BB66FD6
MKPNDIEGRIIENYQNEEKMMVLVFAQWCVNHDLNPKELYLRAYPNQVNNPALKEAALLTVSKMESSQISDQTMLGVLSLYGNDDLAFVVSEEMDKMGKAKR